MNTLILSLGSNQGEKLDFLFSALSKIKEEIGPIQEHSSVYESQAIGFETVDTFYNLCAHITTQLTPESALENFKLKLYSEGNEIPQAIPHVQLISTLFILMI